MCLLRVQSVSCWTISWPSQCLEPNWRHQKTTAIDLSTFHPFWPLKTTLFGWLFVWANPPSVPSKIGTISPRFAKKKLSIFPRTRRTPGMNTFSDWGTLSEIPPALRSSSTCSWVFSNSLSWSSTWACLFEMQWRCLQIASEFDLLGYVWILQVNLTYTETIEYDNVCNPRITTINLVYLPWN